MTLRERIIIVFANRRRENCSIVGFGLVTRMTTGDIRKLLPDGVTRVEVCKELFKLEKQGRVRRNSNLYRNRETIWEWIQ